MRARLEVEARTGEAVDRKLVELRRLYEPYVAAMSERFLFTLPDWSAREGGIDNWRTSAWEKVSESTARSAGVELHEGDDA